MHRGTFAMVDTRAIRENVSAIQQCLHPTTQILVAVKANGYGHGAAEVSKAAEAGGASFLGVASVEEGALLRAEGVTMPILVLGVVSYEAAEYASEQNLSVTITPDCVDWPAKPLNKPLSVHLKVDTGMARLGSRTPEELERMIKWMVSRDDLVCEGIFTHLACADAASLRHSEGQMERFQKALEMLESFGVHPKLVHAVNSAGAMRRPDWQFDLVRVGIAAYGYLPGHEFETSILLNPALSLYSFITRVSWIQPGDTVGYGATFTATKPTLVATVPVGYADGYPRLLSNKSDVIVRGERARVIGNVCMDQLMIDVTDIDGVANGDCVTLYGHHAPASWTKEKLQELGESSDEAIRFLCETYAAEGHSQPVLSLDELASKMGTISYELMCALSLRVPRFYAE